MPTARKYRRHKRICLDVCVESLLGIYDENEVLEGESPNRYYLYFHLYKRTRKEIQHEYVKIYHSMGKITISPKDNISQHFCRFTESIAKYAKKFSNCCKKQQKVPHLFFYRDAKKEYVKIYFDELLKNLNSRTINIMSSKIIKLWNNNTFHLGCWVNQCQNTLNMDLFPCTIEEKMNLPVLIETAWNKIKEIPIGHQIEKYSYPISKSQREKDEKSLNEMMKEYFEKLDPDKRTHYLKEISKFIEEYKHE